MFLTIITFIIILGLLVLVHELGHFITARRFGVKIYEFGLGLPPRIFGLIKKDGPLEKAREIVNGLETKAGFEPKSRFFKKIKFISGKGEGDEKEKEYKNTIYSLNWLPIGGFVKIKGEDGQNNTDKDSFGTQKIWQRIVCISSGVLMNFVLAIVLFTVGFTLGSPQIIDEKVNPRAKVIAEKIQIINVVEGSAAARSGLMIQDEILSLDQQTFSNVADVRNYIIKNSDKELAVKIKRGQKIIDQKIKPQEIKYEDGTIQKGLGVALAKTGLVSYPLHLALWQGLTTTVNLVKLIIITLFNVLEGLVVIHKLTTEISGPVGIAVMTGQVVDLGFIYILQFTALLSINLGVINFFPFPALDGGRVVGLIIEAIRRKPNNQKIEALIHNIGLTVLLALIALVTLRDFVKFGGNFINKLFS